MISSMNIRLRESEGSFWLNFLIAAFFPLSSVLGNQCLAEKTVPEKDLRGAVRTTFDSPNPSKSQLDRRLKNGAFIRSIGLPVLDALPVTEDDMQVKCRSTAEIVKRCIAVEICAVKGESNDSKLTQAMIRRFGADTFFSPAELAFVKSEHPSQQDLANFAWQYERVHVLLWALGFVDRLKNPNEICDVPAEAKLMRSKTVAELMAQSKPRSMKEIMDQADLYYRLHWATVELRLHGKKSKNADGEIVVERHHALNWLIRYQKQSWDDVQTDT